MSVSLLREAASAMRSDAPSLSEAHSWHPAVALAVADWLDACVQFIEEEPDYTHDGEDYALTVAHTYLGSES